MTTVDKVVAITRDVTFNVMGGCVLLLHRDCKSELDATAHRHRGTKR